MKKQDFKNIFRNKAEEKRKNIYSRDERKNSKLGSKIRLWSVDKI